VITEAIQDSIAGRIKDSYLHRIEPAHMGVKWPQREADHSLPLTGAHNNKDSFALSS
jgi:hypothetical protein